MCVIVMSQLDICVEEKEPQNTTLFLKHGEVCLWLSFDNQLGAFGGKGSRCRNSNLASTSGSTGTSCHVDFIEAEEEKPSLVMRTESRDMKENSSPIKSSPRSKERKKIPESFLFLCPMRTMYGHVLDHFYVIDLSYDVWT